MQVDWVFVNGNIHTLDASRPRVQSLAVMGNRVIATGGDADLLAQEATAGKTINLQKRNNDQGNDENGFKLPF